MLPILDSVGAQLSTPSSVISWLDDHNIIVPDLLVQGGCLLARHTEGPRASWGYYFVTKTWFVCWKDSSESDPDSFVYQDLDGKTHTLHAYLGVV